VKDDVAPKSFLLPESVLDKSKACFRRLQNSPSVQTLVIALSYASPRIISQTLSKKLKMDIFWATARYLFIRFYVIISLNKKIQ
jgi:hypothetical protein